MAASVCLSMVVFRPKSTPCVQPNTSGSGSSPDTAGWANLSACPVLPKLLPAFVPGPPMDPRAR
jgi:hypothetical protein